MSYRERRRRKDLKRKAVEAAKTRQAKLDELRREAEAQPPVRVRRGRGITPA